MFATYLAYDLQLAAKSVSGTLSALAYHFRCALHHSEAFTDPLLKACKHALMLDPARQPRNPKRALPITLAMLEHAVQNYSTGPQSRSRLIFAVALTFAFCCLLRPSEYCRTRSNSHVIRARQVFFQCRLHDGRLEFRSADNVHGISVSQVVLIKFVLHSAKNISFHAGRSMWFSSASANPACSINLVTTLFQWAKKARLRPDDFFLSFRRSASIAASHAISYRKLSAVIKETAVAFGFEPTFFSCYSMRIGGASLLRAAGASDGFILLMGRWKSLPVALGYQDNSSAAQDLMMKMLTSQHVFTEDDIRLAATRLPIVTNQ